MSISFLIEREGEKRDIHQQLGESASVSRIFDDTQFDVCSVVGPEALVEVLVLLVRQFL